MTSQKIQRSTAPTEDEIRTALAECIGGGFVDMDYNVDMLEVITDSDAARTRVLWDREFHPPATHRGTLWADLRPTEADELATAMQEVLHEVEVEATAMLLERATSAAVAFAAAHPDIPRGHWPIVLEASEAA